MPSTVKHDANLLEPRHKNLFIEADNLGTVLANKANGTNNLSSGQIDDSANAGLTLSVTRDDQRSGVGNPKVSRDLPIRTKLLPDRNFAIDQSPENFFRSFPSNSRPEQSDPKPQVEIADSTRQEEDNTLSSTSRAREEDSSTEPKLSGTGNRSGDTCPSGEWLPLTLTYLTDFFRMFDMEFVKCRDGPIFKLKAKTN